MRQKRFLSWLVIFALLAGMFSLPAFADGNTTTITQDTTSGTMTITLLIKGTPAAPAAPTLESATKNSITLNTVDGCEYSMDGTSWQDSPEFTGLSISTAYTFYQRVKATDTMNPSPASSASFSTTADTYGMTITLVIEPTITGYALELGGTLGLRTYMALPTGEALDYSGAKMTFTMNQREAQEIPYSQLKTDAQGQYFTCDVYAYQMADTITATFTYKQDNETKTLTDTYSVKQYLDSLKGGEYSGEALALVNATRAYGHFVQPYLFSIHKLASGTYAEMDYTGTVDVNTAKSGAEKYSYAVNTMTEAVKSAQYRLVLNADTSLVVEVRLKQAPEGAVTMTVDGSAVTPTVSGTAYRVEIPNIAANNLDRAHTVILKDGDTTAFSFTASPLSYVNTVLSQGGAQTEEQEALAALYDYYVAAEAYADSMGK